MVLWRTHERPFLIPADLGRHDAWRVTEVKLDAEKQTIAVRLELPEGTAWACPECRSRMHVKERRRRRWRHLDSGQFKTV